MNKAKRVKLFIKNILKNTKLSDDMVAVNNVIEVATPNTDQKVTIVLPETTVNQPVVENTQSTEPVVLQEKKKFNKQSKKQNQEPDLTLITLPESTNKEESIKEEES